jgi:metallo-beta-lactamase family protein
MRADRRPALQALAPCHRRRSRAARQAFRPPGTSSARPTWNSTPARARTKRIVFSGDLGAPYTPLLPAPQSPYGADVVVLESTYGDRTHESRKDRRQRLQAICEHAFRPTRARCSSPPSASAAPRNCSTNWKRSSTATASVPPPRGVNWDDLDIVVDSPLAADFTAGYAQLKRPLGQRGPPQAGRRPPPPGLRTAHHRGRPRHPPGRRRLPGAHRPPRHRHRRQRHVQRRAHRQLPEGHAGRPAPRRAVRRLPGRRHAGPGHPDLRAQGRLRGPGRPAHTIRAGIHTLGGYSAHADQKDLLNFIGRMRHKPKQIRLVHGDEAPSTSQ